MKGEKMKQLTLINPELSKPWLLIAMYDSIWETQNSLMNKLEHCLSYGIYDYKKAKRVKMLTDAIEQTKIALRDADQAIHDYIVSHNTPNKYLKVA